MTIFTTLPPDGLSDVEKIKLVDEVLKQDFNELSDAEKRGFYTSAISKGLKPNWPLQPEKLFTRDDKLHVFFPNFLKEYKITYALDVFPDAIKPYIRQLPREEIISNAKKMVESAKRMKSLIS